MAATIDNGGASRGASAVAKRSPYERLRHDLDNDPRVAQEIALGKRIGFYRLKGQLGAGNFSKVKLGVHLLTGGESNSHSCTETVSVHTIRAVNMTTVL